MTAYSARRPAAAGLLTLVLLVFGFGGWAILAPLGSAVIAPGRIEVERNRQIVQHPDGGLVAELPVTEGQAVAAGQMLLRLDGTALQGELAVITGQLAALRAERLRLEAERDGGALPAFPPDLRRQAPEAVAGQRRLFAARRTTLDRQTGQLNLRLDQIAAQVAGIRAQEAALQRQQALTLQELSSQRALRDKGLTQETRVLGLERQLAGLQGDAGEAAAARAQAEGRATEVALEILRLTDQRREEAALALRDLTPRIAELTARRQTLLARLARLEIRAPVAGVVLGLQVSGPQAVLRPAEPVLAIVPQDRPLVVGARISPLDIDEIRPGQPVRLRLPALPGRTTPELTGQLVTISPDILSDTASGAAYYRAEIRIAPDQIAAPDRPLLPGMPVEAFITTGEHSPLAYLTRPLTDYFRRAFRES
jgi:HlyD family secretion protein